MKYSARLFSIAAATILVFALASPAGAQVTNHNKGFYLRLNGGGGFATTSISDPASIDMELSGIGGDFGAAIGAMVAPNVAIHGNVWGWFVSDPDAKINGIDAGSLGGSLTMAGIGGGATYYFMPANVYITGAAGMGRLSTDGGNSDAGIVLNAAIGKEWFVSPKWGIGLNAGVQYHSIPDGGVSENWSGTRFGVNFSASMN